MLLNIVQEQKHEKGDVFGGKMKFRVTANELNSVCAIGT
jgi:hypothetical protein